MIRHIVTGGLGPGASGVRYLVTRGLRARRLAEILGAGATASMGRATVSEREMGRLTTATASIGRATSTTGEMR